MEFHGEFSMEFSMEVFHTGKIFQQRPNQQNYESEEFVLSLFSKAG